MGTGERVSGAAPGEHDGRSRDVAARLGATLRARRRAGELTVQQLADRAGVSRRVLTQIEQGRANPSLATVDRLAHALGVDLATLVGAHPGEPVTVVAPGAAPTIWSSPAGGRGVLHLASAQVGGPELWRLVLAPGDRYEATPDPSGSEELVLVESGVLTLEVTGRLQLPAGASARIASDRAYAFANDSDEPVHLVRVVVIRTG